MTESLTSKIDELLAETRQRDEETISTIHEMLKNSRRRYVLRALYENGPLRQADLSRQVAAYEYDKAIGDVTDAEKGRVATSFSNGHLQRLAENEFIDWDRDEHVVSLGPRSDEIFAYMEGIEVSERPRSLPEQIFTALKRILR